MLAALGLGLLSLPLGAQGRPDPSQNEFTLRGSVVDDAGSPVEGAQVKLEVKTPSGAAEKLEAASQARGSFQFVVPCCGSYLLTASKDKIGAAAVTGALSSEGGADLRLTLQPAVAAGDAMQFSDSPSFTVAGVTDWTAVGGHGSDATLRTSEDLARATLSLKPHNRDLQPAEGTSSEERLRAKFEAAPTGYSANKELGEYYLRVGRYRDAAPLLETAVKAGGGNAGDEFDLAQACRGIGDFSNAQQHIERALSQKDAPEYHSFSGELSEQMGDSLGAVREQQRAARLDPSEANDFAWGSELLLHRAVWQAAEVFAAGTRAHPGSARMRTGWGAALFAAARYDEAAEQLCQASATEPADPEPYIFMGKIEIAAPNALPCIEGALARFARLAPQSAAANYFYAMALLKRNDPDRIAEAEARLQQAISVDSSYAPAYLQLGILAFAGHDSTRSIELYLRAIAADPQLAEAHYRLGVAYDRAGQPEKARQEFATHDTLEKAQADEVERQRREVKQFIVMLQAQPQS